MKKKINTGISSATGELIFNNNMNNTVNYSNSSRQQVYLTISTHGG